MQITKLEVFHTAFFFAGDKFLFKHGSRVSMYVSDPVALKEIFSNKFWEYERCKFATVSNDLFGNDGLVFARSDEWARQRKVIKPAFFPGRFKVIAEFPKNECAFWTHTSSVRVFGVESSTPLLLSIRI
jgi:cytochrome P450